MYKGFIKASKRGFTLIELLVVIAIIGILASIVLVSLNSARGKGRDAARISSLQEMAKAIAINDTDPAPAMNIAAGTACTTGLDASLCTLVGTTADGFGSYKDPSTTGTPCTTSIGSTCQYAIFGDGKPITTQNYEICTYLENGTGGATTGGLYNVSSSTSESVVAGCH